MSFYASNNEIRIVNSSGQEVFNTSYQMPAITNIKAGDITISERGNTSGSTYTSYYDLGEAGADDFVLATFNLSGGSSYPWRNINMSAGGTVITNLGWHYHSNAWRLGAARGITFEINNGRARIREEYYNYFNTVKLKSFSLSYKAYIGRLI